MDSRRDFLKKAAMLSGAAGASALMPESIRRAFAIDPDPGTTFLDAEHVVILMQENRSFDHAYGSLQGVRGFNDPRAITKPDNHRVWLQTNAQGETFAPFRLNIKESNSTWTGSLPHSWQSQIAALHHGACDRWLAAKESGTEKYAKMPLTMGHYVREDIPYYYALADAFTICDQHFCSSLTGTCPNRLFFWTGTIRGANPNIPAKTANGDIEYEDSASWMTFPERLGDNNVSWKIYQNEISSVPVGLTGEADRWLCNFTDNMTEWFAQYHVGFHPPHVAYLDKTIAEMPAVIEKLRAELKALADSGPKYEEVKNKLAKAESDLVSLKVRRTKFSPENFQRLSQRERNIHARAFTTNANDPFQRELSTLTYRDGATERKLSIPRGDVLHQFRQDVNAGTLPTVSWIVAPEHFSDHPDSAWYGAWYLSECMDILTRNPEVWKKTVFILTYDENDGYFDHEPPFVPPHPNKPETGGTSRGIDTAVEYVLHGADDAASDHAIGLGYRVPMVIASPWSRGGYVCSEVFDHTSVLQFLEKFVSAKSGKKIEESNISAWRRTVCGDLSSSFQPYHGEKTPLPAPVAKEPFIADIHKARFKDVPAGYKALNAEEILQVDNGSPGMLMSRQEPGTRPSCALPYQLYADAKFNRQKGTVDFTFEARTNVFGTKSAGSPFRVYRTGQKPADFEARAFAVAAGDRLEYSWPINEPDNDVYHLRVHGPNGFYREYQGGKDGPALTIQCDYQRAAKGLTGTIELTLHNSGESAYAIEIDDNAYKNPSCRDTIQPGTRKVIALSMTESHGWYDWSVHVTGHDGFEYRYAGRVETGNPGITDPLMGGM